MRNNITPLPIEAGFPIPEQAIKPPTKIRKNQQNDESTPPAETAATLARIEAKLDLVLERLQWAPQSEAAWYAELQPKYSNPPS